MKSRWSLYLFLFSVLLIAYVAPAYAASFNVSRPSTNTYGIIGQREISMSAKISGGNQPFDAIFKVYLNGDQVYSSECFCHETISFNYMPKKAGDHKMEITLVDKDGTSTTLYSTIPVSGLPRYEYPETWEATMKDVTLTGDYRNDLIAIANSQLGYTADNAFIVKNGKHFYNRYGEWYGAPYSEWCVMFISFCANYANIPQAVLPKEANAKNLMDYIMESDAFHTKDSDYVPQKGDIIFLDYAGAGFPNHAGIVERCSGDTVYTVEGNTTQGVAKKEYPLDFESLVGFGSFQTLMDRAGL